MILTPTNYSINLFETKDWKILHEETFHHLNPDETPFVAVSAQIGLIRRLIQDKILGPTVEESPIIRWMTKKEYLILKEEPTTYIF